MHSFYKKDFVCRRYKNILKVSKSSFYFLLLLSLPFVISHSSRIKTTFHLVFFNAVLFFLTFYHVLSISCHFHQIVTFFSTPCLIFVTVCRFLPTFSRFLQRTVVSQHLKLPANHVFCERMSVFLISLEFFNG